jgi:hypothetical protein
MRWIPTLTILALMAALLPAQTMSTQNCTIATASLSCTVGNIVGYSSVALQVTGSFTASLAVTGTVDGTNYFPVAVAPPTAAAVRSVSIIVPGVYWASVAGLVRVKVATASITGTAHLVARPSVQVAPFGADPDANTILNGADAPTTEGLDGDFYIRNSTHYLYGPKASGTWPGGISLVGPQGIQGATGPSPTVASGTAVLGVAEIASGACATAVNATATGTVTTDVITFAPNADISAVTGYAPATTGALKVYPYPSAGAVHFVVCNPTAAAITPGSVTLNWLVAR